MESWYGDFERDKRLVNDELARLRQRKREALTMKMVQLEGDIAHEEVLDKNTTRTAIEICMNIDEAKNGFRVAREQMAHTEAQIKAKQMALKELLIQKNTAELPRHNRFSHLKFTKRYFEAQ